MKTIKAAKIKMQETGLTPVFFDNGVFYEQSQLTLLCRKIYVSEISPDSFIDKSICEANYPNKDYHKVFVGEVVKAYESVK